MPCTASDMVRSPATEARQLGLRSWINGEIDAANLNALAAAHGLPTRVFHLAGGSSVGVSIERPFEDFYANRCEHSAAARMAAGIRNWIAW